MKTSKSKYSFLVDYLIDQICLRDRYILLMTIPVKPCLHGSTTPQKLLSEFERPYKRICRKLVGRNYHRKPHLQPRLIAAFDRIGSKRDATRADRYDACPHLHAVISLDPRIWQTQSDCKIESFIFEAFVKSHLFEEPHLKKGGQSHREIKNQLRYAMKDACFIDRGREADGMSWDMWPRHEGYLNRVGQPNRQTQIGCSRRL